MAACEAPAYTGGAEEIWSGEVTIGNNGAGTGSVLTIPCRGETQYGMLTPEDEFTLGSTDYTIERATHQVSYRSDP